MALDGTGGAVLLCRAVLKPLIPSPSRERLALAGRSRALAFLLAAAASLTARATTFDSGSQGAIVDLGVGTTPVGDFLLGELGGQSAGLKATRDRRWLLQWDGLAGFKGGTLAAAHPYTMLLGGHAGGFFEPGYRFEPQSPWSWYLGLRLAGDFQLLLPPDKSLSELDTVNNIDGVGDLNLSGALRLAFGTSLLDGAHSLVVALFVQESGRVGETNLKGAAFTDLGLEARFDLARSLMLSAEALWGQTPTATNTVQLLTDETRHWAVQATLRKIFSSSMWFGAAAGYTVEGDTVTYEAPAATFETTNAPTFSLTLLYGFALGSQP